MKKILKTGITNLVGIGLIGASAEMVNALPAGTAKTLAGPIPALQSTALLASNLNFKKSKPFMKKYGK